MVGLLEWTGRQVGKQYSDPSYSGVRLVVGDISAPRGGCLAGRSGPRGHASHTTGQDADISFLVAHAGRNSPVPFHTEFDAKTNWWLIKQIFKNPYACVKVIFLDKKLIRKLGKFARNDADWTQYGRFIRHMPAHQNHFHVRIGAGPGQAGCFPGANPEDESEESDGIEVFDGNEEIDGSSDDALDFEAMGIPRGKDRKMASTPEASNSRK
jgi:murein endopeptidase